MILHEQSCIAMYSDALPVQVGSTIYLDDNAEFRVIEVKVVEAPGFEDVKIQLVKVQLLNDCL